MFVFFQDLEYAASTASFLLELHPISMFLKSRISTLVTFLMEVTLVFYLIGLHTSPLTVRFGAVIISLSDSGGAQMCLNVFWNSADASISRGTPTLWCYERWEAQALAVGSLARLVLSAKQFPKECPGKLVETSQKMLPSILTACILTAWLGSLICKDRPLFMKRDFSFKHTY